MRRPIRILTIAGAVPVVLIGLAACTQPVQPPLPSTSTAAPTPTPTVPALTIGGIASIASRSVGGGTITSIEDEADGAEWDVLVVAKDGSEQEVHLGRDGTVLAGPSAATADADQRSRNRATVAAASVTLATAQKRMLAAVPGGRITAIRLTEDADGAFWRGDVLDAQAVRHDVRIDAVNGSTLADRPDATPTPTAPATPGTTSTATPESSGS